MNPNSGAAFSITYEGEALEQGSMSVRDLAPALMSMADLFEAVCEVLNGKSAPIDVHVVATSEGSFEVDLNVVINALDSVKTVVGGFVDATFGKNRGHAMMNTMTYKGYSVRISMC